jgi:hypothetical protein
MSFVFRYFLASLPLSWCFLAVLRVSANRTTSAPDAFPTIQSPAPDEWDVKKLEF